MFLRPMQLCVKIMAEPSCVSDSGNKGTIFFMMAMMEFENVLYWQTIFCIMTENYEKSILVCSFGPVAVLQL